ncbi:MAG: hypothetical protein ACI85I_001777, partial [Arenicella sp.]
MDVFQFLHHEIVGEYFLWLVAIFPEFIVRV